MQVKQQKYDPNIDIGGTYLEFVINLNHELCLLADKINWQYFCGMQHFQHKLPFYPTGLGKWCKRLG